MSEKQEQNMSVVVCEKCGSTEVEFQDNGVINIDDLCEGIRGIYIYSCEKCGLKILEVEQPDGTYSKFMEVKPKPKEP